MISPLSARIAVLLLPSALLGCSDATGTRGTGIAGTYVLRQIAGEPLPAVSSTNHYATITVVAETLFLRLDGGGRVGGTRIIGTGTTAPDVYRFSSDIRHVTRGRAFEGEYVCPPNALCAEPPHFAGDVIPEGLRLDYVLGQRVPFVYERIRTSP